MDHILLEHTHCFGCRACEEICPKHCVSMKPDEGGFLYPAVDEKLCIHCGLCAEVCPMEHRSVSEESPCCIAYQAEDAVRAHSTSGGFFSAVSDRVLQAEGAVYGAAYDEDFRVHHIRVEDKEQRDRLCGSKYVQSDLGHTLHAVADDLKDGRTVLFTGTPCQVSGLTNYLNRARVDTRGLITCDLICHGVPSPEIWKDYLSFISRKYKDKIRFVNFRDKSLGWHKPQLRIEMEGHCQSLTEGQDAFYQMFYSNCILRESCHNCPFSSVHRAADLTMADCWGIDRSRPDLDDNKGLSLVLVNTEKGRNFLEECGLTGEKIGLEDIRQPHLSHPAARSRHRDQFWQEYETKGFRYVLNKYGNYSIYRKMIKKIKRLILKVVRR